MLWIFTARGMLDGPGPARWRQVDRETASSTWWCQCLILSGWVLLNCLRSTVSRSRYESMRRISKLHYTTMRRRPFGLRITPHEFEVGDSIFWRGSDDPVHDFWPVWDGSCEC